MKELKDAVVKSVNQEANDKDVFKFDFSVPSSPALTLLGVDKNKVTQSNSLKPFVLSLPSLLDSKETGQSVALDIAPAAFLIPAEERTFQRYQGDRLRQLLFRTRTAVALYEGVNDATPAKRIASRLAMGFSTSLLGSSDPIVARLPGRNEAAWTTCFEAARPAITENLPNTVEVPEEKARRDEIFNLTTTNPAKARELVLELNAEQATLIKVAQEGFAKSEQAKMIPMCVKVADLAARLGSDLDLGAGAVWHGAPGELSDFKDPGAVMWASFRTSFLAPKPVDLSYASLKAWHDKLDQWFMVGVSGRFGVDERIATGDKARPEIRADTYSVWLGLERYTPDSRVAVQVGEEKRDPGRALDAAFKGSRGRYLVSYDQKLGDNLIPGAWATLSYGKAEGTGSLKDDKVVKFSLTFTTPNAKKIFGAP